LAAVFELKKDHSKNVEYPERIANSRTAVQGSTFRVCADWLSRRVQRWRGGFENNCS